MAVYQISKIQIRRGKKNSDTGLPQLASGELAWAIDSQELYIGNGSVSEGAPFVGNTKILTQRDNILDIAGQYQYKQNDPTIQTNIDVNRPVRRSIQERLDESVTSASYGILANGLDQSDAIQHAIYNLFKNISNINKISSRITLHFLPGEYTIAKTIKIPSNVSIVGSGINKTIFHYTSTGNVFQFINDNDSTISDSTFSTQPRYCALSNFSIVTDSPNVTCLKLNAVRNSVFENISLVGTWTSGHGILDNSIGISMHAFSSIITSKENTFSNIDIDGFCMGVHSKEDISNNMFDRLYINTSNIGISFGVNSSSIIGQQYGPRRNIIKNCEFENISKHGILIEKGTGNKSRGNNFINVGNNMNGINNSEFSIIKLSKGNSSIQDSFDRNELSSYFEKYTNQIDSNGNIINTITTPIRFNPEIEGFTYIQKFETQEVTLEYSTVPKRAFRLPLSNSSGFNISYIIRNTDNQKLRKGEFSIAIQKRTFEFIKSTASTTWDIEHNLNSLIIGVEILLDNGEIFRPSSITIVDVDTISISLSSSISGTCIVSTYDIQYSDNFDFTGNIFSTDNIILSSGVENFTADNIPSLAVVVYYTNKINENTTLSYTYNTIA